MSVDSTLSTVMGRPAHDWNRTTTRKASVPTMTADCCLFSFKAYPPRERPGGTSRPGAHAYCWSS